ncbi:glycerophosphodiester phosphodiesterase [Parendozoicomonas haliclonae]|uniref:Glycerophosphoryl diester phosphodiesterase n=1 Tax=Parendozoicomonas haliclonae TaxID=1960125 RepID=A0A1X7AE79_9GAMM|nr:glycerophosphodiester phosphodiesterase [Parendozoicomonas haliclonae]SMA31610.1 Glycerophosphoryl diester phosphodiesterase precursor [Parendozoicomonas haliclonae]
MIKVIKASLVSVVLFFAQGAWAETTSFDCPCPHNLAHRGASGLFPQATAVAFDEAIVRGADVLEMDVQVTADGQLLVHHDDNFKATAGVNQKVADMTLTDIRALDAGHEFSTDGGKTYPWRGQGLQFLTLEDVALRYPEFRLNVEMKPNNTQVAELMVAEIERLELTDRIVVASFNKKPMKRFREIVQGSVPTSAFSTEISDAAAGWFFGFGRFVKPKYEAAQVPLAIASKPFVSFLQSKNVKVHIWTTNSRKDIERALDMGADGVIGDYPALTTQILYERGLR